MAALATVAGVVTAFAASACVVTTDDGNGGASGAAGANTAGANTAGANTAGASGAATAGAAGAPAVPYQCTPDNGDPEGMPNSCEPAPGFETDKCALCVKAKCCTEFANCYATAPGNQCGWGGPNDDSEIGCIQDCIKDGYMKTGVYDDPLVAGCANGCGTNKANHSTKECGQFIGQQTSDLVACLRNNCEGPCFTGEL